MRFSDSRRLLLVLIAVLCLAQSVAGVGVGSATVGTADARIAVDGVEGAGADIVPAQATPTNNTSVQQENPYEVDESGDTDALRSYLAERLAERLGESSVEISQGQYEQGQSVLGDEYDSILEQYVDVAGGAGDNPDAESFEQARESQRQYSQLLQEYNETYQAYQEARAAGNATRARELARELNRLATQIEEAGGNVTRSYTRVENTTGADLSNASQAIENTTQGVSEQQETVVSETFVETTLTARADAETVEFDSPARITGRIVLENGTALANETATLRIGPQTRTVETDGVGSFALDYQPVRISANADNLSVRYLPADGSVYLGSNATLALGVEQATGDLTLTVENEISTFGDRVVVDGRATVNGTPVPHARVRVSVGDVSLGTVKTGTDGRYSVAAALPATVPTGDATVEAQIVPGDRAVRSDSVSGGLRIERTSTALSVNANETAEGIRATGTLRTADGRPLAGRTVELRVNGTTVATVDTGSDGGFARSVSLGEGHSGTVTVAAVFDQPQGNLESSTAEQQVDLEVETPAEGFSPVSIELLAGGGVAVLSIGVIVWLFRRESGEPEPTTAAEPPTTTDSTTGTDHARELLERAGARASAGDTDDAVLALYAAVRRSLAAEPQQTHWEFYAEAVDRLDSEAAGTLERLTEAYERALYSPSGVDAAVADDLVDGADRLLDRGDDAAE